MAILKLNYQDQSTSGVENLRVSGYFSIDKHLQYHSDASQMQYIYPEYMKDQILNPDFDLNQDYHKIVSSTKDDNSLPINLCKWIMENPEKTEGADFICFRGILSRIIIGSMVESKLDWRIGAYKLNDSIYLCNFDTEIRKQDKMQQMSDPMQQRFTNWGYKFEQFMLTDDPQKSPSGEGALHLNEEFCVLINSKLKHYNLLYGAEMDGIVSDTIISNVSAEKLNNFEFVELKSGRPYGEKMLNWWAQSYLAGIKTILCGKKVKGHVVALEKIDVDKILYMDCIRKKHLNLQKCCSYLSQILEFIHETVNSNPSTYWLFEWNPSKKFEVISSPTNLPEYKFLDEDFITFMESLTSSDEKTKILKRKHEDVKEEAVKSKFSSQPYGLEDGGIDGCSSRSGQKKRKINSENNQDYSGVGYDSRNESSYVGYDSRNESSYDRRFNRGRRWDYGSGSERWFNRGQRWVHGSRRFLEVNAGLAEDRDGSTVLEVNAGLAEDRDGTTVLEVNAGITEERDSPRV